MRTTYTPKRPNGFDANSRFDQAVWDRLFGRASQFMESSTVHASHTTRGIYFEARPAGGGGVVASEYHLKSVQDDYLTCRSWNGNTEGGVDIFVAKQPKNRTSLLTATVYGVVHTYTYQTGPDAFNLQRTNNDGSKTETELITPAWIAGDKSICDIIYAIPSRTSLKTITGAAISLIEVGPWRQWAAQ